MPQRLVSGAFAISGQRCSSLLKLGRLNVIDSPKSGHFASSEKLLRNNLIPTIGLCLLIASVPMGAGGQNITSLLVLILWLMSLLRAKPQTLPQDLIKEFRSCFVVIWAFLLWVIASSLINGVDENDLLKWSLSWLPFAVFPYITLQLSERMEVKAPSGTVTAVLSVMILVILTQRASGWALSRGDLIWEKYRAQIFYSHPMTAAYVVGILFSAMIPKVFSLRELRWKWMWLISGFGFGAFATESRTVQIALVLLTVLISWLQGSAKTKRNVLIVLALLFGSLTVSENRAKQKFMETIENVKGRSQQGQFVDDRLIFWFVHMKMISDRPLLGYGAEVNQLTREKYYIENGFRDLRDKYEAHNQYIQWAVESGVVGVILACTWLGLLFRSFWRFSVRFWEMQSAAWVTVFLMIAMMTQNAFNDSEVRHALLVVICVALARVGKQLSKEKAQLLKN